MKRRWLGVLLSLLVPGFGVLRAGLPRRAFAWFIALQSAAFIGALSLSLSEVPFGLAIFIFTVVIFAQVWMLCDSFRPGRMTPLLWLVFAILIAAIIYLPPPASLAARFFKIPTGAMEPTLIGARSTSTPDHVIVDRFSYHFSLPRRGDLVVFATSQISGIRHQAENSGEEVFYAKRLVGLPGEKLRIADGKLFADGRPLGEADGIPAIIYTDQIGMPGTAKQEGSDFVIGPDEYFVLGDNSPNSFDSRYWGCVPASAIYGKVTTIYYPFSRAGRISAAPSKQENQTEQGGKANGAILHSRN